MLDTEGRLKLIKEIVNNTSSLFIIIFILLMVQDVIAITFAGYELKDIKYLISFSQVLFINLVLLAFLYSINNLLNKESIIVKSITIIILMILVFISMFIGDDAKTDDILTILLFATIVISLIGYSSKVHDTIIDFGIIAQFFSIFFSILMIFLITINSHSFERVKLLKSDKIVFYGNNNFISLLFRAKSFHTSNLEENLDFINFKNSQKAILELTKQDILTKNSQLPYYNYENKFVWYLDNNKYRTFFIVNKKELKYNLTTIITEKDNDFFIIIDTYSYPIKVKAEDD